MKSSRSRVSLRRALFISGFAAVAMFSTTAMAATSGSPADKTTQKTTTPADKSTAESSAAAATTAATTGRTTGLITATGAATTDTDGTMPAVTSSSSKLGLPTLSTTNTAVPTYPAPSVPPTADAPFMHRSNLPDGTVFIVVGAILGAFGAAILIWRAVVAYLLHRSIARAALAQHLANDKAPFASASNMPLYKYSDHDSSLNLGGGGLGGAGTGRGVRRTNRGPTHSATPSQTNLFFSPTAPGAAGGANNRDSRFLPSGFYAAGAGAPAGAPHGQAISMTNMRPDSFVNTHPTGGPSPPDSPNFGPLRASAANYNMSGSSASLNRPPSGRAPSAFLDDLLDEQPHLFPVGSGPSHDHSYSPPGQGPVRY
ncbi:csi2 protein [Ophiostoma piceae UAMH 11346]|uniref:Csi2 protein n=1 Tax=Ophiostoma piceae (strain UAMH 11346) TaxID=1262450 RepID=S3D7M2_OPHP1|nr:csi2 protein [Ophiostoma piceae UAMH 11346]